MMANLVYYSMVISLLCASRFVETRGKLLYVFGDSLFDPGNNQYYTPTKYIAGNHHPYGSALYTATGRFSDGLLVPDFIAEYEDMPLIPPALDPSANGTFGYNFASLGGSVYYSAGSVNLKQQLSIYMNLTATKSESSLEKSVYLFSIGGNDYATFATTYKNATEQEMLEFADYVIQGIKEAIMKIYKTGGRKFAFQDVGPMGCLPTIKYNMGVTEGCYEELNTLARFHNIALRNMFNNLTLSQQYGDIKYGIFDYYNQLSARIANPTDYGFMESEIACCGYGGKINGGICGQTSVYFLCSNPSAFIFFDSAHTTQALNSQIAKLIWIGDQTMISPYNVKQLFNLSTTTRNDSHSWDS